MLSIAVIISISYVVGVAVGAVLPIAFLSILLAILLSVLVLFWSIQANKTLFILLPLFFLLGLLNYQVRQLPPPADDVSRLVKGPEHEFAGQVADEPRYKDDQASFILKARAVAGRKMSGSLLVRGRGIRVGYGDRLVLTGRLAELEGLDNPGLLSYADYLQGKGISCQLLPSRGPPVVTGRGGNPLVKLSLAVKNALIGLPARTMPEPYAGLLTSIVFGSRAAGTPAEIKETYKKAGVAHLLVASGMHLGILIGVCLCLVRALRLPLWSGILVTSSVNLLYALMTGFGPSILRAAIMAQIMLAGLLVEREKEVYTSLALSALAILLWQPAWLFDVGFQLSFAATWSLVYAAPVFADKLRLLLPRWLAVLAATAVAPVLASTPITLFHFSECSLIGVLTNMLLLPWIGQVVVLGFVGTMLGALWLPLGELVNSANLILLFLADRLVNLLAALPFARIFLAPPGLPLVVGYYLGLAGLVEAIRRGRLPALTVFRRMIAVLMVGGLLAWHLALLPAGGELVVTVLDVGQGDAILFQTPTGRSVLIDGGAKGMGERVVLPFLRRQGIRRLDLVVLTHAHDDHLGGLLEVLGSFPVEAVSEPGMVYNTMAYRRFLALIRQNRIKYHPARAGQRWQLDKNISCEILHPAREFIAAGVENINNSSVVLRLVHGNFSLLMTGDNEKEGERAILERYPANRLRSEVIKLGHHGSSTSTLPEFLAAVSPRQAIISCGRRNRFRHPHPSTVERIGSAGIRLWRTDRQGAIVIRSNGRGYRITGQR